jgi:hypothetical protein
LKEVILEKLTQFSPGTIVLYAPTAIISGFHWTDNFISSTYLIRPIWNSMRLLHLENYDLQEIFLSKTNSILTGKQYS